MYQKKSFDISIDEFRFETDALSKTNKLVLLNKKGAHKRTYKSKTESVFESSFCQKTRIKIDESELELKTSLTINVTDGSIA